MPIFPSEFYCGLLIGVLLGFMLYYTLHQNKLHDINQKIDKIINLIEPKKRDQVNHSANEVTCQTSKNFKNLFGKKAGLDPNFSFNRMVTEIRELREEKATLKSFYQWKTNPRKRTLEAIQEWIDKNKIKTSILDRPKYRVLINGFGSEYFLPCNRSSESSIYSTLFFKE